MHIPYEKAANGREAVDLFEAGPLKYSMVWMGGLYLFLHRSELI